MILEIIQDGDKRLLKKSKRVSKIDDVIRNISANMVETMISSNGVGLAANQVGILKKIITVLINQEPKVFINPEIIFKDEEEIIEEEGCLSFKNQFYKIPRSKKITLKYRDLSGHPHLETYENFVARIIQHEIDHLSGIVFTEYINKNA